MTDSALDAEKIGLPHYDAMVDLVAGLQEILEAVDRCEDPELALEHYVRIVQTAELLEKYFALNRNRAYRAARKMCRGMCRDGTLDLE